MHSPGSCFSLPFSLSICVPLSVPFFLIFPNTLDNLYSYCTTNRDSSLAPLPPSLSLLFFFLSLTLPLPSPSLSYACRCSLLLSLPPYRCSLTFFTLNYIPLSFPLSSLPSSDSPQGCIELLDRSGVVIEGKEAVVLGRSNIVGECTLWCSFYCNALLRFVSIAAVRRCLQ